MPPDKGRENLKVVLLGSHNVGKSSIVERFIHDRFTETKPMTVGAAFAAKTMVFDGKPVTVGVWDTAGTEQYESMARIYYRSAACALVCYDVTSEASWKKVRQWIDELRENEKDCIVAITATKCDLLSEAVGRAVSKATVMTYAREVGPYTVVMDTSAKTGTNIDQLFYAVVQKYLNSPHYKPSSESGVGNVSLQRTPSDGSSRDGAAGGCC